jgi:hypothetical protein
VEEHFWRRLAYTAYDEIVKVAMPIDPTLAKAYQLIRDKLKE